MFSDFRYRVRALLRKRAIEDELDEELQFHLEHEVEKLVRGGLSREDAVRRARITLGGVEQTKESCRESRGVALVDGGLGDIVYAARMLRKRPGFTATVVVSLALGIGANTAIFTLVDALMWRILPVADPANLWLANLRAPKTSDSAFSYAQYKTLRDNNEMMDVAAYSYWDAPVPLTVSVNGNLENTVEGLLVSGNYFSLLGVAPVAGRIFGPDDDRVPGGHPVAVISEGYWARRFARDPAVIGASIAFGGTPFTIVGVAPREFFGVDVGKAPDVFVPMMMQAAVMPVTGDLLVNPTTNRLFVQPVGRLKPGVTPAQASAAMTSRYRELEGERAVAIGRGNAKFVSAAMRLVQESTVALAPAATGMSDLRRQFSQPLFILFIVVALVLTVACANTATLLLVRSSARTREFAMRAALGASRARLASQLLVESLMLAGIGGAVGILLARASVRGLVTFMSTGRTPIVLDLDPSPRVLAFTAAVSMLTGILFGLIPALKTTRIDLTPSLKQLTTAFRGARGLRSARVLAVAQIALSLVLLTGAGLFVRSLQNLNAQDAGFDRARVLIVRVEPRGSNQRNPGEVTRRLHRTYLDLLERVSAIPGVAAASLGNVSPMKPDPGARILIRRPGDPPGPPPSDAPRALYETVYPSYFKTMGLPILAGRDFGLQDQSESSPPVCIINEAYARLSFPNGAIGETIPDGGQRRPPSEIVGVARDSRYTSLRGKTPPALYTPFLPANTGRGQMILYVRVTASLGEIVPRLREAVWNADRTVPQFDIRTLAEEVDGALIQERLIATLSALFGILALILAAVGLYGLFAFAVVQRTGEIGLRMALGATRGDVVRMVMREAALLVAAGVAIGIPAAFAAARVSSSWIAGLLFGLQPNDPLVLASATIVLAAVAAIAVYLPARRASGVSPIVALRTE